MPIVSRYPRRQGLGPLCRCAEEARTETPGVTALGCLPYPPRPCILRLGCAVLRRPFDSRVKGISHLDFTSAQAERCGHLLQPQARVRSQPR